MSWKKQATSSSGTTVTKGTTNGHIVVNGTEIEVYNDSSVRSLISQSGGSDSSGLFYDYQNLWVNETSGTIDYTPVLENTSYVSNCLKSISCYDQNKTLITTVSPSINNDSNYFAPRPFVTPAGTKYIKANRPGIFNASWDIILIKGNETTLPIYYQYVGNTPPNKAYYPKPEEIFFFLKNKDFAKSLGVQTSPLYGKKINFLGDSITYGNYADPETSDVVTYHQLLAKKFNLTARNYGYAGSGFVNLWNTYDAGWGTNAAYFQRSLVMDTDADMIVVWGGFNDRQQALGTFGDTWSETTPTIYGAIDQLNKNLKSRFPNKPIVYLIHFANDNLTTPINNAVKAMCNRDKIPYIDLSPTILSDNYNTTILQTYFRNSDWNPQGNQGIHPNSLGYKILARHITRHLEDIMEYL